MDEATDIVPSSPTISSLSSSDLDTESTGSFFHDRSTSLGTLMGVSIPEISATRPDRLPSRRDRRGAAVAGEGGSGVAARKQRAAESERRRGRHRRGGRGGRRWWMLCREEDMAPTSLGEFLQVERRLSSAGSPDAHFFYGGGGAAEHEAVGGGALFENGRVLPPPPPPPPQQQHHHHHHRTETGSLGRLPVLLTGICSGGEG